MRQIKAMNLRETAFGKMKLQEASSHSLVFLDGVAVMACH